MPAPKPFREKPFRPFIHKGDGLIGILSDLHVPYHDPEAVDAALDHFDREAKSRKTPISALLFLGDQVDCVTLDTKILTWDLRWVPAGELSVGDELIGFDENLPEVRKAGNSREIHKSIVESNRVVGKQIIKLTMSDGTVLRCTAGHKWLGRLNAKVRCTSEWIVTSEIVDRVRKGKPVFINKPTETWQMGRDYDSGYLSGAFDGEGCVTFHKRANNFGSLNFTQRPNIFLCKVEEALVGKGYDFYRPKTNPNGVVQTKILGGMWEQARFIGSHDIPRMRKKWAETAPLDGFKLTGGRSRVQVVSAEDDGIDEVVVLQTSTKTYFAEGFCSHNCHEISAYQSLPGKPSYREEVKAWKAFAKYIESRYRRQQKYFKFGNHDWRVEKYLLKNAPALLGMPGHTLADHLGLAEDGFTPIAQDTPLFFGKATALHGHEFGESRSSPLNPAKTLFDRTLSSAFCGHHHQTSSFVKQDVRRNTFYCHTVGCLSTLTPEYRRINQYNHGAALLHLLKGGDFRFDNFRIIRGKIV